MITTIKIILIIMAVLSLIGTVGEKDNAKQFNLTLVTITNIAGIVILSVFA